MFHNIIVQRCDFTPGQLIGGGRYYVEELLNESTLWKVFKVRQADGLTSAFKILKLWDVPPSQRQDLINRFNVEYATGQTGSPYLMRTVDSGTVGENPFIVAEYGEHGNLTDYMRLYTPNAARIARTTLGGLNDLHRNGKAHHNLRPDNVLIRRDGSAFLADFDIDIPPYDSGVTLLPSQIEASAYLAPEIAGKRRSGTAAFPASDMFAFGVIMFYILTGQHPYGTPANMIELSSYRDKCIEGKWNKAALQNVPDKDFWRPMLEGCLHPDYVARFRSAADAMPFLPPEKEAVIETNPKPEEPRLPNPLLPFNTAASRFKISLRVISGSEPGKVYILNDLLQGALRVITIGRGQGNVIRLKEEDGKPYMSRRHCTIETNETHTRWLIRDGQLIAPQGQRKGSWTPSANGTFVNDNRVNAHGAELRAGSTIKVGNTILATEEIIADDDNR
jgi:serine/threonine protein kinase